MLTGRRMDWFLKMEKPAIGLFLCFYVSIFTGFFTSLNAQHLWSPDSYPDEVGFQKRMEGALKALADREVGKRAQGTAMCPDTGLSFKTWAVEGEYIYSPYTGRRFQQGPTGYFGPKERGKDGEITRFGGDALKKDLIPATAKLLLDPGDSLLKAFLAIPGNMNQQYHFAAKNWARFYPLLADTMSSGWRQAFQAAVANYSDLSRPSDGYRVYAPLSTPHDLVGEPGELLGGNKQDGGTENHKIMWRSAASVYAHHFPDDALISGQSVERVDSLVHGYFVDFLKRLLKTGNGEYDSEIYYPHSLEALLNIYDFSKTTEMRAVARAILDYYLITLAVKTYDGALAGAQKRGPSQMNQGGELSSMFHLWFGSRPLDSTAPSLHQLTSSYRPNSLIWKLYHKEYEMPLELKISRPTYHMDRENDAQEYFYGSKNVGLGSIYLSRLDNPNQQVQWSLVFRTAKGPRTVGGGQPFHLGPGGHSPYTQTMQHKQTLLVAAAETARSGIQKNEAYKMRTSLGKQSLKAMGNPPAVGTRGFEKWMEDARFQQACWLFLPSNSGKIHENDGKIFLESDQVYLVISPFNSGFYWIESDGENKISGKQAILENYSILVVPGPFSGYALEVHEKNSFVDFHQFTSRMQRDSKLKVNSTSKVVAYRTSLGDDLLMNYHPDGLRASGAINGIELNFDHWSTAGVYSSDLLQVGAGSLQLSIDGKFWKMKIDDEGIERE
ncbi:hypothetical protein [Cyclobacterium roseum]|uniref:hypothetical protein n=1 Tax=Cyclobacterium roseum TaxID=2666137 RepID=UPI001391FEA4|nr:hypothetical protein [Cyclobacterium roseum]